ncbi:MAG: 4-(cytidine 5'-diphospho)-2-C-methyl-D-erythritol kinase [Xanthomonadales bacterium]|nr:4-(cytidine 5'-diphospho)-2-C-methyl-D-erythritol kinase [Gammaproteobacteria bacterium]MBT8053349.1 4-(cytidine 5'-diphospho)-2-C-methyl-D-erythritol kinase [Gammaproteobacteria bacterium]NND58061.1 4-(cytidine 5'-diphospho)-2-C-methyl-D-erythritol kinase [Xanthomonadales bacterium]NNK52158.1 4-(cytidine 5'-diphospho)-2-C-methyl-D-erythritol kinase [Xanthomonadales bacterium]
MNGNRALAWPAPAKINLFLRVTGRRPDGYHNIQTLFQLLDWGDEVRILPTASSRITRLDANYSVPESEDLVVRAARLLQAETGCRQGAELTVDKRIPLGSGMGGGSSDAATVLLVLNRLWDCGLSVRELARLGRILGADVPVFIHGRSAMAEGIGERLEPVSLGERHYLLVFPEFSISTSEVFSDPGLPRNSAPISLEQALAGEGGNDCEAVVKSRFPEFAGILESLQPWGEPLMTGTGSGIFLPMPGKKSAISAARALKTLYNVRAVRGVDRSELHAKLDSG